MEQSAPSTKSYIQYLKDLILSFREEVKAEIQKVAADLSAEITKEDSKTVTLEGKYNDLKEAHSKLEADITALREEQLSQQSFQEDLENRSRRQNVRLRNVVIVKCLKHLVKPEHVSNRTVAVRVAGEATRAGSGNGRIYVGNLPADVREKELEELFHRYGRIRSVELKNRGRCSSSPFAFIKFQDPRDAEDAVFGRNGYDFGSCRLRVEFPRPFRGSRGDGGGYGAPRGRNGPPSRRSDFRVLVSGLPPSGSWQDLKDHMRKAGDVCYADVHKDGMGIVEFIRKEDMEYALRKLDDTKFRSHEGENYYIRVCPERNASYSRSRSRSRGHDSPYQSRCSPSPFRPY
ncbi:serine/arginine-rich splicing factor 9-like [Discoglossus pictus]